MDNLAQAVNTLQESLLFDQPLQETKKMQALQAIRSSFAPDNPYLGFAFDSLNRQQGLLITGGEKMYTRVGIMNVLGLEAVRLLRIFEDKDAQKLILPEVEKRIKTSCYAAACTMGECAHATAALWRYQAAGGLSENREILEQQIKDLQKQHRLYGNWKAYPFYYTLLALTELQTPLAEEELKTVKESCLRRLKRNFKKENPVSRQRLVILGKALEKIH